MKPRRTESIVIAQSANLFCGLSKNIYKNRNQRFFQVGRQIVHAGQGYCVQIIQLGVVDGIALTVDFFTILVAQRQRHKILVVILI